MPSEHTSSLFTTDKHPSMKEINKARLLVEIRFRGTRKEDFHQNLFQP